MKYFQELMVQGISPARFLMHRALEEKARIISPCADLGGGEQTYLKNLKLDSEENILLVDRKPEADVTCNLEDGLPFLDRQFKTVLMLNALELIFNFQMLCREINRILEKGGKAYVWIPFLINVHQDPVDYFRYTDNALKIILQRAGFSNIEIQAYGGLGLVIGTYVGQLAYKLKLAASVVHVLSFGLNRIISAIKKSDKNANKWPLGYFVTATA